MLRNQEELAQRLLSLNDHRRKQSTDVMGHGEITSGLTLIGRSVQMRRKRSASSSRDVTTSSWSSYDRLSVDLNGLWESAIAEYVPSWSHDDDVTLRRCHVCRGGQRQEEAHTKNNKSKMKRDAPLTSQTLFAVKPSRLQFKKKNKSSCLKYLSFAENKPIHKSDGDDALKWPKMSREPEVDHDVIDVSNYIDSLTLHLKLEEDLLKKDHESSKKSHQSTSSLQSNITSQDTQKPVTSSKSDVYTKFDDDLKYRPALSPINETALDEAGRASNRKSRCESRSKNTLGLPEWYPSEAADWSADVYDKWWEK